MHKTYIAFNILSPYRNCHFIENDTVKKIYLNIITEQTRKMQTIQKPPHFHYKIYVANKRTDGGNVRSIIEKFFLDDLVEINVNGSLVWLFFFSVE